MPGQMPSLLQAHAVADGVVELETPGLLVEENLVLIVGAEDRTAKGGQGECHQNKNWVAD